MSTRYSVTFARYTERNYIKKFKKKYSEHVWQLTENAIRALCENLETALDSNKVETISQNGSMLLCKLYFAVAGTKQSAIASGCRCILIADREKLHVTMLLVYHKADIVKGGNETVAWKKIILSEFPEYKKLIN